MANQREGVEGDIKINIWVDELEVQDINNKGDFYFLYFVIITGVAVYVLFALLVYLLYSIAIGGL